MITDNGQMQKTENRGDSEKSTDLEMVKVQTLEKTGRRGGDTLRS